MELTTSLIMDLIVAGLLAAGTIIGVKRGFIKTIAGLIISIVAIFGARFLSNLITDPITTYVYPYLQESISSQIENKMIDVSNLEIVNQAIQEATDGLISVVEVTAQAFVRSIVHTIAFLFCYIVLLLLLRLLIDVVDKFFDMPLLKSVNGTLGGICGLLEVVLVLFLVPYLAKHLGIQLFENLAQDTKLLAFFVNNSLFDAIQLFIS